MTNPIALMTISLGGLVLLVGMVLMIMRVKTVGVATCLVGAGLVAFPFVTSFFLGANP